MGKIYESMYQAFKKASDNWDDAVAYQAYADLVKKYLGATKFSDAIERGKVTVELARRKLHEKGFDFLPDTPDESYVLGTEQTSDGSLVSMGPGPTPDADGYSDVGQQLGGTPWLDQEQGMRTSPDAGLGHRPREDEHQSLGSETVCDSLQGRTRQDQCTELPGGNLPTITKTDGKDSGLQTSNGNNPKSRRTNPNTKDKAARRRVSRAKE